MKKMIFNDIEYEITAYLSKNVDEKAFIISGKNLSTGQQLQDRSILFINLNYY